MSTPIQKASKKINDQADPKKKSEKALELATAACEDLFTDQYSRPYAVIRVDSHTETLSLQSQKFRNWIAKLYFDRHAGTLSNEDVTSALNVLKAKAQFSGVQRYLDIRVVSMPGQDAILYDLTNEKWECVKVTKDDWSVDPAPVVFTRYANHKPQVYPAKEYPADILDRFMQLVNVINEDDKLLLRCYLVSLFIPDIAKPAHMLHGPQGSAKSTLQELIKMVVDPSVTKTLSFPRDSQELTQKLAHNYVAYFDNVSSIPDWISDDLCKAVTGSGFSKRALYTDDDDVIYSFKRCIGFNGINLGASRADLLDRGLIIQLERIPKDKRRKQTDIWKEFDAMLPQLLGFIMDVLVKLLQRKGEVQLKETPRMADFAEYGELIGRCLGYSDNEFIRAYFKNIDLQTEEVLESHPVGLAIKTAVNDGYPCGICERCDAKRTKDCTDRHKLTEWTGTAGDLLATLTPLAQELNINKDWPRSPSALGRALNDVATNLKEVGIIVERQQTASKRLIQIRHKETGEMPSLPSSTIFYDCMISCKIHSAEASAREFSDS